MQRETSEKVIERELSVAVVKRGGYSIKLASPYVIGLPDRLCLFPNGQTVFVELKSTGKKPRRTQEIMHEKLRKLGFRVEVIDSLSGVNNFINSIEC